MLCGDNTLAAPLMYWSTNGLLHHCSHGPASIGADSAVVRSTPHSCPSTSCSLSPRWPTRQRHTAHRCGTTPEKRRAQRAPKRAELTCGECRDSCAMASFSGMSGSNSNPSYLPRMEWRGRRQKLPRGRASWCPQHVRCGNAHRAWQQDARIFLRVLDIVGRFVPELPLHKTTRGAAVARVRL